VTGQGPHGPRGEISATNYYPSSRLPSQGDFSGNLHGPEPPDGRRPQPQMPSDLSPHTSSPARRMSIQIDSRSGPPEANRGPSQSDNIAPTTIFSVTGDNTFYDQPSQQGQQGQQGQLDSRFQPRSGAFYRLGTVFAVLWHVPGSTEPPKGNTGATRVLTVGKYGEPIYSTIRRMVVVREGHGFCVCIQINTYGGRGLKKFTSRTQKGEIFITRAQQAEIENHSIIHMADTNPSYINGEPSTSRKAIPVDRAASYQRLGSDSRLCYSQPSTVQHNVKAMHVGQVKREYLPWLVHYYNQAQAQ
jgi:hypothetical protein